jgi:hypothetical protein
MAAARQNVMKESKTVDATTTFVARDDESFDEEPGDDESFDEEPIEDESIGEEPIDEGSREVDTRGRS